MRVKTSILLIFLILTFKDSVSQTNLVPNPSFEDTVICPQGADISNCVGWTAPSQGTTDFFNTCYSIPNGYGVPQNVWGYQNAFHGNGYAMVITYGSEYREYLQVMLNSTLINNTTYLVSYYTSLADSVAAASNNLGFSFSPTLLNVNTATTLPLTAYYTNTNVITNQNGWTKISSIITATGNENYLIIGNFLNDNATSTSTITGNPLWETVYFIDSVSVKQVDVTNLVESKFFETRIYPNPATEVVTIDLTKSYTNPEAVIYSWTGQLVIRADLEKGSNKINTSSLPPGLYSINLLDDKRLMSTSKIKIE